MIKWDEVQHETEAVLESVRRQMAQYRQRISELESETEKLTATIAVARQMQEGGFKKTLNPHEEDPAALPQEPGTAESDPWQLQLDRPVLAVSTTQPKSNWQKGVDALGDLPDLPPAIGLRRQPNKSNTSYRAAALLKEADAELHIDDIIAEFNRRNWVDPTWARPKEAINIAVKRSVTYGWTTRTGRHTFAFSPQVPDLKRETSEATTKEEG